MQRVWFNKTFSSVATAMRLIREADIAATGGQRRYHLIYTNPNEHAAAFLAADEYAVEPTDLKGEDYLEWCLAFCRERAITIFWPGRAAGRIASARARFEAIGTRVLSVATEEVLILMHDKARFCAGLDLPMAPVADTRAVNTIAEYDAAFRRTAPAACAPVHQAVRIRVWPGLCRARRTFERRAAAGRRRLQDQHAGTARWAGADGNLQDPAADGIPGRP